MELLEKMKTTATTSSHSCQNNFGGRGFHPTFEEIKNSLSSSMFLSGSDVIRVGRFNLVVIGQ